MDATTQARIRWFHLTPGRCLAALLVVAGLLFLAEWFHWLPNTWSVVIAVATVGAVTLAMLLWLAVCLLFRWRFQFSLRSLPLLAAMVVVLMSLFFSWVAREKERRLTEMLGGEAIRQIIAEPDAIDVFLLAPPPRATCRGQCQFTDYIVTKGPIRLSTSQADRFTKSLTSKNSYSWDGVGISTLDTPARARLRFTRNSSDVWIDLEFVNPAFDIYRNGVRQDTLTLLPSGTTGELLDLFRELFPGEEISTGYQCTQ